MVVMLMVSLITLMMRTKFLRAGTRALRGNGIVLFKTGGRRVRFSAVGAVCKKQKEVKHAHGAT